MKTLDVESSHPCYYFWFILKSLGKAWVGKKFLKVENYILFWLSMNDCWVICKINFHRCIIADPIAIA